MTPAEADQRIMLSRQTLAIYKQMVEEGVMPSSENLDLIFQEVGILEDLALAYPGKAEKLMRLAIDWTKLHDAMRVKLH